MPKNEFELKSQSDVHLSFLNHDGSVEHYYHFLLGFFIPLILACEQLTRTGKARNIYVRSCGIF